MKVTKIIPPEKWHPSNIGVIDMTQIIDDPEPKPAWQSITNISAAVLALAVFLPPKYRDIAPDAVQTFVEVGALLTALYGRWRAGGVSVPFVGAKKK